MSEMGLNAILAMAPATTPGTTPNPTGQLLQMLGTFLFFGIVMYFIMIRPQQKKAKEQAEMMKSLKAGDKVITSSGILGVIVGVKDRTISICSADTKLEILKSAVIEITERVGGPSES